MTYQEELAHRKQALSVYQETVKKVAKELKASCLFKDSRAYLTRGRDIIILSTDEYGKVPCARINARGEYRQELQHFIYSAPTPNISVSANRSPEAIATDIERRLVPAYRELVEKAEQRKAEHDAVMAIKMGNCKAIASASRGSLEILTRNDRQYPELYSTSTPETLFPFVKVSSVTQETVDISLDSVPIDTAIQIAALLSGLKRKKAA
jgi:hypothetical protein